ncbi:hypothetical protein FS842_008180 [Serendipita sp. 407]|nr:hypothetical protein FRC20_009041 [Serendipita sp. 405]KAG9053446.1 hypothetical protein FS842_008180 [Serendipita sp. 407]
MMAAVAQTAQTSRIQVSARANVPVRGPRSDDGAAGHKMGYFDKYPARASPGKLADDPEHGERFPPSAPASLQGHYDSTQRKTRVERSSSVAQPLEIQTELPKLAWPTKPVESEATGSRSSSPESSCPKSSRPSNASVKSRTRNSVASTLPELRYSASTFERSSLSPPHTPVGTYHSPFAGDSVVVAAPAPGIEMMDALVDVMNGGLGESSSDGNDYRSSRSRRHGARKHLSSLEKRHPGLHPHSTYTPPLPKPPHGIKLGSPDNKRNAIYSVNPAEDFPPEPVSRPQRSLRPRVRSSTNADVPPPSPSRSSTDPSYRRHRSSSHIRKGRNSNGPPDAVMASSPTIDQIVNGMTMSKEDISPTSNKPSMAPSISDIIRAHAPELAKTKHGRPHTSPPLPTAVEETEHDDETASRSSLDSITHEVQSSLRKTQQPSSVLHHARSFPTRPFATAPPTTYNAIHSLRISESEQDPTSVIPRYAQSVYSASSYGFEGSSVFPSTFFSPSTGDSAMAIAQYLRSPKLTRLMTLRRPPHRGLTVSLADVGNPNGLPVLVFLGLGCVRYLVALYDEMAEALGLRLIAIDRWGMGRTGEVPQDQRGLKEWAGVCEEVIDTLGIKTCGVFAHSAGAPYALAFALRASHRINGSIHLLAPWVGGGIDAAGYKWLKYVPNSFIRAAQNAEWKVHGWKLGKPPTIVYEGIGFDPKSAPPSPNAATFTKPSYSNGYLPLTADALKGMDDTPSPSSASKKGADTRLDVPTPTGGIPRTSMGGWSDYDDLADFEGRFGSQTTLPTAPPVPPLPNGIQSAPISKKKGTNKLFGILKSPDASNTTTQGLSSPGSAKSPPQKLKGFKSITLLKEKISGQRSTSGSSKNSTPKLESTFDSLGAGLGIDVEFKSETGDNSKLGIEAWASACSSSVGNTQGYVDSRPGSPLSTESHTFPRSRRSVSLTASAAPTIQTLASAPPTMMRARSTPVSARPLSGESATFSIGSHKQRQPKPMATTTAPTSSVATALLRASHKEAQKGLANDLLSILERDAKPWGFSYADVRQKVRVWYGDRDEKIGEAGIRWMERVMKDCELTICKGKDHSLMTCASVVVEALESLQAELRREEYSYT